MHRLKVLPATLLLTLGVSMGWAGQQADNTAANKGANQSQTADNAKNNKSDLKLMKEIRRAVMKDKSLSTDAHNVKIVASGGKVTLKGPVKSEEEKKAIEDKANQVAGDGNVTSEITVAGSK